MSKCQCSMAIRMTGEGCRYCQPQTYIDRVSEWLQDSREEAASLEAERDQLKAENARLAAAKSAGEFAAKVADDLWAELKSQQSAPAGYVMVPVEPTPEMKSSALDALDAEQPLTWEEAASVYRAMLEAAPKAEQRCEYCEIMMDMLGFEGDPTDPLDVHIVAAMGGKGDE